MHPSFIILNTCVSVSSDDDGLSLLGRFLSDINNLTEFDLPP